ncbi:MAG: endonuclease domain-containing protein [Bacteroidia bacterium]
MGKIAELSRELRKNATPFENELWEHLRRKQLGVKFLRQQPIIYQTWPTQEFFIADFLCFEKKLIVELDGKVHDFQKDYDANRDEILE